MQLYNGRQFSKDNSTIPNLPAEYQINSVNIPRDPAEHWSLSDMKEYHLSKNDVLMLKFKFSNYDNRLVFISANNEAIIEDGTNIAMDTHRSVASIVYLDDLYYKYNPINLRQRNGKVFSKTFLGLRQRLGEGREYLGAKLTQRAIAYVGEHVKQTIKHTNPELTVGSFEFYQACNNSLPMARDGYLGIHSITGEPTARPYVVRCRQGLLYLTSGEQPQTYGYHSETYRYDTYWLKEGEFMMDGTIVTLAEGSEVCPDCGTEVPLGYMTTDPDDGHRTCKKCASTTYEIHSYSTRAPSLLQFKAKKVTPETIYLGCELEYETTDKDRARRKVGKALRGHAIMKGDGSINNGFEVVTCPATLEIQLEVFKKFFENRPAELKVASNVGMHVHVSRKPLSVLTVGKMTEFMNRKDNVKFITHIAGRAPNTYCKQEEHRSLSFPLVYKTGERYNTLNLNNKETIEFRIFSTPLSYEDFASKMQFCQALTDYSKPGVLDVPLKVQTSYTHFIKWAISNHKFYPELVAKLKSFSA